MAIFNCPECGGIVSDKAKACPHCGYPISNEHIEDNFPVFENPDDYTLDDIEVGCGVSFGNYYKDTSGELEPIWWTILKIFDNHMLLVTEDLIDAQEWTHMGWNGKDVDREDEKWESSSIREWLNDDFLNLAFSKAEQTVIEFADTDMGKPTTLAKNSTNVSDKVFLLSLADVKELLKDEDERIASCTAYTKELYPDWDYCSWATRTIIPSESWGMGPCAVGLGGTVFDDSGNDAWSTALIRPAIILDINKFLHRKGEK